MDCDNRSMITAKTAEVIQFIVGGLLTVAASKLSVNFGPQVGALIWTIPLLMIVSVMTLRYSGNSKRMVAQLCFSSFWTTLINAIAGVILGVLVLTVPGDIGWAVGVSVIINIGVAFGYYKYFLK